MRRWLMVAFSVFMASQGIAWGQITRVWLTHRTNDPSKLVVNWETSKPGKSVVEYGLTPEYGRRAAIEENVTLHHVEIPLAEKDTVYHYKVSTGSESSGDASFKAYPTDTLRVAVVADWQSKPKLDGLMKDNVHLLLTGGDNISCLWQQCGMGVKDGTKPYGALVDAYPELFRSTPFLPALGNHDREIRPRGDKPPVEPVYDVEATAFRQFFALPDDGWKWHFDIADFDVRFVGLDLNHIRDMGTTWQTCHPFGKGSEQYEWYDRVTSLPRPAFLVTVHNERNSDIRSKERLAWHRMFSRGTIVISGFGYFAERAEVDGFTYYNTSLSGRGDKYPDPKSSFFQSEDNYILLTLRKASRTMKAEVKRLDGEVLDALTFPAPGGPAHPAR